MRSRALLLVPLMLAVVLAGCEQETPAVDDAGGPIRVGKVAPSFSLPAAGGGEVSLADYRGSSVLLYFSMGPG